MGVLQKLLAFVVALLLAFAAGFGLGGAVDPVIDDQPSPTTAPAHGDHQP